MIKIIWKHRNHGDWECIGSYDDLRDATKDFVKYRRGVLNETGVLKLITDECELQNIGRLIRGMSLYIRDLQDKVNSQAEHIKALLEKAGDQSD